MNKLVTFLFMVALAFSCWGEVSVEVVGDLNGDKIVDVEDVNAVINIILSTNNREGIQANADLNGDEVVDVDDLNIIINFILEVNPLLTKYNVNGVTFTMVAVKGGTYMMGATENQLEYAEDAEMPAHQVTVSNFSIGQTTVTQELWMAIMGNNPSYFSSNYNIEDDFQRPVELITWYEIVEFISTLNDLTDAGFRIPTEAEWEFAARGGNKSHGYLFAGSDDFNEVGWNYANTSYCTQPVGLKKPNELGLYDMSGNVWEMCNDWWDENYYSVSPAVNPQGPETGTYKSARGGSLVNSAILSRVSMRDWVPLDGRYTTMGFRLAQ